MTEPAAGGLPEDVLRLIADDLESMEQVEILLLLRGDEARARTANDVAAQLRLQGASAAKNLAALEVRGLVAADGASPPAYRYAPRTAEQRAAVDGLVVAYNTRPVTLVKAIYDRPPATNALRTFADAFRIRKPEGGA